MGICGSVKSGNKQSFTSSNLNTSTSNNPNNLNSNKYQRGKTLLLKRKTEYFLINF